MRLLSFIRGLTNRGSSEARILVLGLDNAGKSTILARLSEEEITTIRPTHGFVVKSLKHENIRLNVWDVGGQKSVRPFWRNYFNDTDGLVSHSDFLFFLSRAVMRSCADLCDRFFGSPSYGGDRC